MRRSFIAPAVALAVVAGGVRAWAAAPAVGTEDFEIMQPYAQWVHDQYASGGQWCCDIADGRPVEARTVDGHWQVFVTSEKFPGSTRGWMSVPDGAVLHQPNPVGVPIAWIIHDHLFCFAPAGGV